MASKLVGHKDIKTTSEHYLDVDNREDLVKTVNTGNFVRVTWCGERACV